VGRYGPEAALPAPCPFAPSVRADWGGENGQDGVALQLHEPSSVVGDEPVLRPGRERADDAALDTRRAVRVAALLLEGGGEVDPEG
jgi:hypothetical protein